VRPAPTIKTFHQRLVPSGVVEKDIAGIPERLLPSIQGGAENNTTISTNYTTLSTNLIPRMSYEQSYPAKKIRFIDETIEQPDPNNPSQRNVRDISGALWMLARMTIHERLDNPRLETIVATHPDGTKTVEDNPDKRKPVIGLLCRDLFDIIMHFALGVSPEITGYYKNTDGALIPVTRQDHLGNYAYFTFFKEHFSHLILNDLIQAIKNDERDFVKDIIKRNSAYLLQENSDGLTALEAAFQTDNHLLVEMITNVLEKLPTGKKTIGQQLQKIFPKGYNTHCKEREAEAIKLFIDSGIITPGIIAQYGKCTLFDGISKTDIDNLHLHVPIALRQKIAKFKELLEVYYKTHPFHNDYILQLADEIYAEHYDSWSEKQLKFFSNRLVGRIIRQDMETSLFCLKNHAQGIEKKNPGDSFNLRGTQFDIRSFSNRLGVDFCVDIFGGCSGKRAHRQIKRENVCGSGREPYSDERTIYKPARTSTKFISAKRKIFSNVVQKYKNTSRGSLMQCFKYYRKISSLQCHTQQGVTQAHTRQP